MAFMAQVKLSDVPLLAGAQELLSFHYCQECTFQGHMPWGKARPDYGYALDLFDELSVSPDGLGVVTTSPLPPSRVTFSDVLEAPDIGDYWRLELEPPPIVAKSDFDERLYPGLAHVSRSKLGGWPSWPQEADWPECSEGRHMLLVLQLDYEVGEQCSWAAGGYAFVFTCSDRCQRREAELVIQTT